MLYHSLGPCGLLTSGADVAGGVRGPCYTIDWGPVVTQSGDRDTWNPDIQNNDLEEWNGLRVKREKKRRCSIQWEVYL